MVSVSHSISFIFNVFPFRRKALSAPDASQIHHRLTSRRWLSLGSYSPLCRLYNLKPRCSITNSDLRCGQILTDEEAPQQESGDEPDCSSPIIHIKSDILETEPLSLLAEATFVDSLLTALPVLSEEEQNALAATPAHPVGLYAFYATCLAGNLVEQLWNFAWPSATALIHPSLLPVAWQFSAFFDT